MCLCIYLCPLSYSLAHFTLVFVRKHTSTPLLYTTALYAVKAINWGVYTYIFSPQQPLAALLTAPYCFYVANLSVRGMPHHAQFIFLSIAPSYFALYFSTLLKRLRET